jgi:hypothetical protein
MSVVEACEIIQLRQRNGRFWSWSMHIRLHLIFGFQGGVEYQSFWNDPNYRISPEKYNLNLTKMIWTQLNQFVPVQNNLDGPKSF